MADTARGHGTDRYAMWQRMLRALDELDAAWREVHAAEPDAPMALTGDIVVKLAGATGRGTVAIAGLAEILERRLDSGGAFRDATQALHDARDRWPPGG
ncbi:hypothetical protein FHS23_004597 [Prauserella isguenensis]|uniref:Uncharacterized protein n=1 Tax=Prauserella isguenensis TaxID=1470180 RepID=A0A839S8E5_9PSEU|nr:hypothetical protein [Prauserella isguenensis]MBB3053543.1 hypothetical protein [Prauserella isguenensis]